MNAHLHSDGSVSYGSCCQAPSGRGDRIALQARVLDAVERMVLDETVTPAQRGKTWYEVWCGLCRSTFRIDTRTLDAIITRYAYIHCANAACGERLYAMPHEDAADRAARRSRS